MIDHKQYLQNRVWANNGLVYGKQPKSSYSKIELIKYCIELIAK